MQESKCGGSITGMWLRVGSGEGKSNGRDSKEVRRKSVTNQMILFRSLIGI